MTCDQSTSTTRSDLSFYHSLSVDGDSGEHYQSWTVSADHHSLVLHLPLMGEVLLHREDLRYPPKPSSRTSTVRSSLPNLPSALSLSALTGFSSTVPCDMLVGCLGADNCFRPAQWPRICNNAPSIPPLPVWNDTTWRKTLRCISKRSLIGSTGRLGIASSGKSGLKQSYILPL